MPMILNLANGTTLRAVPDQSLDTTQTSIALIGKGWIGYTEFWNQNLLGMLANFASPAMPHNPLVGQLWFDENYKGLRLQVGIGAPDADANGWSTRLATTDNLARTPLVFTASASDIVVPAIGTVAAPPALVLKNVNMSVAANTTGTFNTLGVNAKGLVVNARNIAYITDMVVRGDVAGTSIGNAISLALATVNSDPGIFNTITVNAKGLVTAASNTPYLTRNQSIAITGDATGAGSTDIALTLAAVNSNIGTFNTVIVNAKGLVVAATNTSYLAGNHSITVTGDATGNGINTITLILVNSGVTAGTYSALAVNAKGLVTAGSNLSATGDATGTAAGSSIALTLANSGVAAGTYNAVTVDDKGRVTAGSNLTLTGEVTGTASGASIALTLANSGVVAGTYSALAVNAKGLITTGINMTATGDATGTAAGSSIALTLANSGVVAGTYSALAVNAKGLVTAGIDMTATGDATGTAVGSSIALTLANSGVVAGTYNTLTINQKGIVTAASDTAYVLSSLLGASNGVATLDGAGKLTTTQLPAVLVGAVIYQGTWNATTNTPALASGTGTKGFYYKVSVAGGTGLDGITQWNTGDTVIFDGATWDKIDGIANEVLSVNGQTGIVTITSVTGNAGTATKLALAQTIALSGDATGSASFDGSNSISIATTLVNSGVAAGTYSALVVNAKGLVTTGVNMTATGDATGTATGSAIALTLANSGVVAGNYNTVTVSTKGLVTAASNTAYLTGNQSMALTGDATGTGSTSIAVTLANSGAVAGTYSALAVNAKGLVTTGINMTATGDATGTAAGSSIALTLVNSGVVAGNYNTVTVNAKGLVTTAFNTAYLTGNQSITLTGDATGTGSTSMAVTLANSGAVAGTYSALAVNAKGLVTTGINMTATGDATGTAAGSSIALTLANSGAAAGTFSALAVNAKGLVTAGVNMTATGDATGTASGSSIPLTLVNSGVTAGNYNNVTVNAKGLVTAATNTSTTDDLCVVGTISTTNVITDASKVWWLTVDSNTTLTINVAADSTYAKSLTVALVGDGSHSTSFAATGGSIAWDMGSSLPMNTAAGKTSVFTFLRLPGTSKWFAGRAVYEG